MISRLKYIILVIFMQTLNSIGQVQKTKKRKVDIYKNMLVNFILKSSVIH